MGLRFYIRVVLYEHVWILKFLAPATPCATSICSICRISKTDCMARFPRRHRRPFMFCRPIWRRRSWVYPTICNFKTKKNRCFDHHLLMCSTYFNTLTLNIFFEASNIFQHRPTWPGNGIAVPKRMQSDIVWFPTPNHNMHHVNIDIQL